MPEELVGQPRTVVGRWLRAYILVQEEQAELNEILKRTGSWRIENRAPADAVIDAAFTAIIRQRFAPDTDVADITHWVNNVRRHFKADLMSVSAGQALVRAALGEEVPIDDISVGEAFLCRYFIFGAAFSDLYWGHGREKDVAALDAILMEAERVAWEKGLRPLLLADVPPDVFR